MKQKLTTMAALLLLAVTAMAQKPFEKEVGDTKVQVEFYTPTIVRIVKMPAGTDISNQSLVVTAKPADVKVSTNATTASSKELTVKMDPKTGALTFLTAKGKVLLREKDCAFGTLDEKSPNLTQQVRQRFILDKNEAIYGLGTIQNGKMNRRGEHKRMEQSNLEDFQNVLQSIKGWGIYWDNYAPTQFDDDENGMSFTSEVGKVVDYYFMYGGSAAADRRCAYVPAVDLRLLAVEGAL